MSRIKYEIINNIYYKDGVEIDRITAENDLVFKYRLESLNNKGICYIYGRCLNVANDESEHLRSDIKLEIEYSSIIELIKLCEQIDRFNKKRDINRLFKIPEKKDMYTLNLFFNYENSFIENKKEINRILLQKILNVYEIDEMLIKEQFLFFSKTIQPHIIILEKYLKVIFKNL